MHNGVRVCVRAELRLKHGTRLLDDAPVLPAPPAAVQPARANLQALNTGDARLAQAIAKVDKVLGRGVPVLITGETGTGKEWLAQAIHRDSPRARGPFIAVNCAAIPEALIESELFGYEDGAFTGARRKGTPGRIMQAHGGTLFLDEIGDMPLPLQARLLRVLEERKVVPLGGARALAVDIELVCATNHDLRKRIADGQFREDLYYRLNGLVVKLPPLRERSDLDAIVGKMLGSAGRQRRVADEVLRLFRRHAWPGNLRQLASLLRTASLMAGDEDEIGLHHLPDDFFDDLDTAHAKPAPGAAPETKLDDLELSAILRALDAHGGKVSAAARALGVSRNTIYRKLRKTSQQSPAAHTRRP
jgi:transcriptional regulator with PAS, ATPase and Fis domain